MQSAMFYIIFSLSVLVIIGLELLYFHYYKTTHKQNILWSLFWIALALAFGFVIYKMQGREQTINYYTGYLIEKSLSLDNLFVFAVIFKTHHISEKKQKEILLWGIIGALVFRGIFIAVGVTLLQKFHWLVYPLGLFLIYAGYHLLKSSHNKEEVKKEQTWAKWLKKKFHLSNFILVLIIIEVADLVFAVDSIPAVMAITLDPLIIYTSNVMAILGLRALYSALMPILNRFRYIHYGLSIVIIGVGIKMILSPIVHVPSVASLLFTVSVITITLLLSWKKSKPHRKT
ncbi:MAG: TerC family protein [Parachlamydiales bacterium]|nr:TerC family protein [Parachlamydiales bacterium]